MFTSESGSRRSSEAFRRLVDRLVFRRSPCIGPDVDAREQLGTVAHLRDAQMSKLGNGWAIVLKFGVFLLAERVTMSAFY